MGLLRAVGNFYRGAGIINQGAGNFHRGNYPLRSALYCSLQLKFELQRAVGNLHQGAGNFHRGNYRSRSALYCSLQLKFELQRAVGRFLCFDCCLPRAVAV